MIAPSRRLALLTSACPSRNRSSSAETIATPAASCRARRGRTTKCATTSSAVMLRERRQVLVQMRPIEQPKTGDVRRRAADEDRASDRDAGVLGPDRAIDDVARRGHQLAQLIDRRRVVAHDRVGQTCLIPAAAARRRAQLPGTWMAASVEPPPMSTTASASAGVAPPVTPRNVSWLPRARSEPRRRWPVKRSTAAISSSALLARRSGSVPTITMRDAPTACASADLAVERVDDRLHRLRRDPCRRRRPRRPGRSDRSRRRAASSSTRYAAPDGARGARGEDVNTVAADIDRGGDTRRWLDGHASQCRRSRGRRCTAELVNVWRVTHDPVRGAAPCSSRAWSLVALVAAPAGPAGAADWTAATASGATGPSRRSTWTPRAWAPRSR